MWAAAAHIDQCTLRRRLEHGMRCKDKMIRCNIRLVVSIAKNYVGSGLTFEDLVQVCVIQFLYTSFSFMALPVYNHCFTNWCVCTWWVLNRIILMFFFSVLCFLVAFFILSFGLWRVESDIFMFNQRYQVYILKMF
jgi:Sigma-70 region 2